MSDFLDLNYAVLEFNAKSIYQLNDIKGAVPASLSAEELTKTADLLTHCIATYNKSQAEYYATIIKKQPDYSLPISWYTIDLPTYKRQYVPFVSATGEKEVWVNCFCTDGASWKHDYWREDVVFVMDGGNCYFNVMINLTKGLCYDLMVNGHA
jgi:hypothetical protein